jgi:hypothetical protein
MSKKPEGPSFLLMLTLLGVVILIAFFIAYRIIAPSLHR